MHIKVLGKGCKNCALLERHVTKALADLGLKASLEKVTDMDAIIDLGVMKTPGLVIDDVLVLSGRVPAVSELKPLIEARISSKT